MAIAVDATASGSANSTTLTVSHTCTGSDLVLVVVCYAANGDQITGVTYNAASMTQAAKITDVNNTGYIYYLVDPDTGANDIVVTASASQVLGLCSCSYTDADVEVTPSTSTDKAGGTSVTSLTTTINTGDADSWHVAGCGNQRDPEAGTNAFERVESSFNFDMFDSNGTIGTTGNHSMTCTFTSVNKQHMCAMALIPHAASGTNFQINIGDAWKTVAGLQINIGDVWKSVAGAQINIGDAWKTIF